MRIIQHKLNLGNQLIAKYDFMFKHLKKDFNIFNPYKDPAPDSHSNQNESIQMSYDPSAHFNQSLI